MLEEADLIVAGDHIAEQITPAGYRRPRARPSASLRSMHGLARAGTEVTERAPDRRHSHPAARTPGSGRGADACLNQLPAARSRRRLPVVVIESWKVSRRQARAPGLTQADCTPPAKAGARVPAGGRAPQSQRNNQTRVK